MEIAPATILSQVKVAMNFVVSTVSATMEGITTLTGVTFVDLCMPLLTPLLFLILVLKRL